jgi:hypothetical protein
VSKNSHIIFQGMEYSIVNDTLLVFDVLLNNTYCKLENFEDFDTKINHLASVCIKNNNHEMFKKIADKYWKNVINYGEHRSLGNEPPKVGISLQVEPPKVGISLQVEPPKVNRSQWDEPGISHFINAFLHRNSFEMFNYFLKNSKFTKINATDNKNNNAIHLACQNDNFDLITHIISHKKFDKNILITKNYDNMNVLDILCIHNKFHLFKQIIEQFGSILWTQPTVSNSQNTLNTNISQVFRDRIIINFFCHACANNSIKIVK